MSCVHLLLGCWISAKINAYPGFRQLSYETRLDRLKLSTLGERRNRADLLEVFKMYKGMSLLPFHQFFRNSTVVTTRGLWPFSKDCQNWVPFRCATLLRLKPCYLPMEPVTSNSHRVLQCKLVRLRLINQSIKALIHVDKLQRDKLKTYAKINKQIK